MKTVIVCESVSHGNTRKVAEAVAETLGARVVAPAEVDAKELAGCDLVGFASGVYFNSLHPRLYRLAASLPRSRGGKAFIVATSGGQEPWWWPFTRPLRVLLRTRGYEVVGTFVCRGFDTWLPLQLVGGLNKGRPDTGDLEAARAFGTDLRERFDYRVDKAA